MRTRLNGEIAMKTLGGAPLFLVVTLAALGTPSAMAAQATPDRSQEPEVLRDGCPQRGSQSGPEQIRAASYAAREASSLDLEPFEGGRQVILATEHDFQILMSLLLVTIIVLLVVIL
jgi:hypothetical protein